MQDESPEIVAERSFFRRGWSMQTKLIVIFLLVKVIPLILLTAIAWHQFQVLGETLKTMAVADSAKALNDSAIKNIERITTDAARQVARFLYARDSDIRHAAQLAPTEANYRAFLEHRRVQAVKPGPWVIATDPETGTQQWVPQQPPPAPPTVKSRNAENNIADAFHYVPPVRFEQVSLPLFDEITFVALDGREQLKVVSRESRKRHFPLSPELRDVSRRENTYVKAETYFPALAKLAPGDIHVSDVIGAYVGSNLIGPYTPASVKAAAEKTQRPLAYDPEQQAYAGRENPVGRRFEGIVRWATPVTDAHGEITGYVTLALNHDHIMEMVDHITPTDERYVEIPSAFDGNYAFIWDYRCRSIAHPRHYSIVGFNPDTGEPEIPWLESSLYEAWQKSGIEKWTDFMKQEGIPEFHEQSRDKKPAPDLTAKGLVGLDGRYLNNAPQCIGWMDLTESGGSGSFYIRWSGVDKLSTAAAIPYYTGPYAPSPANKNSHRGFGFVAVGSGLDDFTLPAETTKDRLTASLAENMTDTATSLVTTTIILTIIVIWIAIWMAWGISRPIRRMAEHLSRLAIGDFMTADIPVNDRRRSDEIGLLACSLHGLTLSRRDELVMANALAEGDYTRTIALKSDLDLLGKTLNAMIGINRTALIQMNRAVRQLGAGAHAVTEVSVSLSQGVQTSESEVKTISETLASVDRQAKENVTHAQEANQLAISGRDAAQRGYEAVTELVTSMAQIQQAGRKIAVVAKLIDDIAFQTNLLALNAAVEAARAGYHGKGFAIVAEEVRNLSARSAKAAHETGEMVASMISLMETGEQLAVHSDKEFRNIVEITAQAARYFGSIMDVSNAQSVFMANIVRSLERIDRVTKDNSQNARQMAASAGELSRQAEDLGQMASRFRLGALDDDNTDGGRTLTRR